MNEIDFININHPLDLGQEFNLGSGYIKITGEHFNKYTGDCSMTSEILDAHHSVIGNVAINGHLLHAYQNDHGVNIRYGIELNLEGDIKKILSL